jgi:hypothetical protein
MNINNEDIRTEREKIVGLQNQIRQELTDMGARSVDECVSVLEQHLKVMRDTASIPLDLPPTHEAVDLFAGIRPVLPTRLCSYAFTGFLLLVDAAESSARLNLANEVLEQLDIPAMTKHIEKKSKRKNATCSTEQLKVVTVCTPEQMRDATLFDIDSLALRYALCIDALEVLRIAESSVVDKEKCYAVAVSLRERCAIELARPKARTQKPIWEEMKNKGLSEHQSKIGERGKNLKAHAAFGKVWESWKDKKLVWGDKTKIVKEVNGIALREPDNGVSGKSLIYDLINEKLRNKQLQ